jgi:hypothetical protein
MLAFHWSPLRCTLLWSKTAPSQLFLIVPLALVQEIHLSLGLFTPASQTSFLSFCSKFFVHYIVVATVRTTLS